MDPSASDNKDRGLQDGAIGRFANRRFEGHWHRRDGTSAGLGADGLPVRRFDPNRSGEGKRRVEGECHPLRLHTEQAGEVGARRGGRQPPPAAHSRCRCANIALEPGVGLTLHGGRDIGQPIFGGRLGRKENRQQQRNELGNHQRPEEQSGDLKRERRTAPGHEASRVLHRPNMPVSSQ